MEAFEEERTESWDSGLVAKITIDLISVLVKVKYSGTAGKANTISQNNLTDNDLSIDRTIYLCKSNKEHNYENPSWLSNTIYNYRTMKSIFYVQCPFIT